MAFLGLSFITCTMRISLVLSHNCQTPHKLMSAEYQVSTWNRVLCLLLVLNTTWPHPSPTAPLLQFKVLILSCEICLLDHLVSMKKDCSCSRGLDPATPSALPHLAYSLLESSPLTCTLWSFLVTCFLSHLLSVVYSELLFRRSNWNETYPSRP